VSAPLHFRTLAVRRMPGFPSGGIRLEDLSPGINLVCGRNGTGKTTAARALQHLLWPGSSGPDISLAGRFLLDAESWLVDVDGSRRSWQRDGLDAGQPALPPADHRDRYFLSLHDLLAAEDRDLAEIVYRESAGGYSLRRAGEALKFGKGGRPAGRIEAAKGARQRREAAIAEEQRLARQQQELQELETRHEALRTEAEGSELLARALDVAAARERHDEELHRLESYPSAMAALRGNEGDLLHQWAQVEDECGRALVLAEEGRRQAEGLFSEAGGREAVPDHVVNELEALRGELQQQEGRRDAALQETGQCEEVRRQAARELGAAAEHSLDDLSPLESGRLDALLAESAGLRERRAALTQRIAVLKDAGAETDDTVDEARLHAIQALREWLRTPAADESREKRWRLLLWTAVLALGISAATAFFFGQNVPAAVAFAAMILLLVTRPGAGADTRATLVNGVGGDYAPPSWEPGLVQQHLAALEQAHARAREAEPRRAQVQTYQQELTTLDQQEAEFRTRKAEVEAAIGLGPQPDLSLLLLATRLRTFEEAGHALAKARGTAREVQEALARYRERAARLAEGYGLAVEDAATCAAAINTLRNRREVYARAADLSRTSAEKMEGAQRRGAEVRQRRAELFRALGMEADQEHTLPGLLETYAEYRQVKAAVDGAAMALDAATRTFAAMNGGEDAPTREGLAELKSQLSRARQAASDADDLYQGIARIKAELQAARRKHDLEEATAALQAARAGLVDQRELDTAAAVGQALLEWVQAGTEERNRPHVFNRGRELFQEITRYQYQLTVTDVEPAEFRATDVTTGRGHALSELSSGTRVQLLLAMRMAFVENMEAAGARLPLLMDEVLANSDDERAAAIIDAAVALARSGRQVFYFTAQADELSKWRRSLESADVPWSRHELGRSLVSDSPAFEWALPEEPRFADASGLSHQEYGLLLGVPPADPWAESQKALHLWYLVQDTTGLQALLSRGIRTWGQLELYLRSPGSEADELLPVMQRASRNGQLCEHFLALWRVGRGRPVDEQVIAGSGAITGNYIAAACTACKEVSGDAVALLQRVRTLPRFRAEKFREFERHLEDGGYLPDRGPMEPEEVMLAIRAEALRIAPHLRVEDLRNLVERLAAGVGLSLPGEGGSAPVPAVESGARH
jgi:energy-coupling factor transporter ATP-binding protein EcfA2